MDIVVAEKSMVAEAEDGTRKPIKVTIGRPYRVAEKTWSCPLRLEGVGRVSDGLGADSWSALTVAIGVVRQQLDRIAQESRLVCSSDGSEIDLDDLFPQF